MLIDSCGVCDRSDAEKLLGDKPKSKLGKSSLSIPCLIHRPKQSQLKGVIQKVERDRFVVYIPESDSTVTVPKLLVYPDFSGGVGQIEKNPRKKSSPSKNSPRKTRRKKGEGSGSIYYRIVTKNNGKQYQEAYYHWRENGKKRTKYIPKKLLDKVKEAEQGKLPVSDILILLGGNDKSPRKSSSTLEEANADNKVSESAKTNDEVLETSVNCPRKIKPPSKRRKHGYGGGYIECKPITRSGKQYKQYWYHYEFWREGDVVVKKSRYIPKRLLARVEKLEVEKAPVRKILEVLRVRK